VRKVLIQKFDLIEQIQMIQLSSLCSLYSGYFLQKSELWKNFSFPSSIYTLDERDFAPERREGHARDVGGVQVRGARLVVGAPHLLLLQDRHRVVADDGLPASMPRSAVDGAIGCPASVQHRRAPAEYQDGPLHVCTGPLNV